MTLLTAFVLSVAQAGYVDRVAATVGDEVVALSEVYDLGADYILESCPRGDAACVRTAELDILDSLILRSLVRKELADLGIDVTSVELDQTFEGIAQENGMPDADALRREVERSGESWETYRSEIREQLRELRFQKWVIEPRIPVSEDEMIDLYRRTAREMSGPPRVKFSALVLRVAEDGGPEALGDTVMLGHDVRARVLAGELTWEQAVADFHSGLLSGPDGNALRPMKDGDLDEPLNTAVFGTPLDGISEPVTMGGMVFLVKPTEHIAPDILEYDQLKDRLEAAVKQQKAEDEIDAWYVQARRRASVRILLEERS